MNTVVPVPKRITLAWLRKLGACNSAVTTFKKLYPRGAERGLNTLIQSPDFDSAWLAERLLTPHTYRKYQRAVVRARREYRSTHQASRKGYKRIDPVDWAEFQVRQAIALVKLAVPDEE